MNHIAIVTDTDCCLPVVLSAKYQIIQVPIMVHINGQTYKTGIDLDDQLLFSKVDELGSSPTTSAPPPAAFIKAFTNAIDGGAHTIICICVSRKISASFTSASIAANTVCHDIHVIDSQNIAMSQGFIVLVAAEMAKSGGTKFDVIEQIEKVKNRVHTFAVLPSLKYIARSGRINKITASIADTLDLKPILTVRNGRLEIADRQRTYKKAIEKMFDLAMIASKGKCIERGAILHAAAWKNVPPIQEKMKALWSIPYPFIVTEFTPGVSVHTGSGTVGITIMG